MKKIDNYMGGSAVQISRFVVLLMYIFASTAQAGLIFEFQSNEQFELNEDGNISGATINDNVTSSPTSNALLFDCSSGGTVLWIENDHNINITENFEDKTSSFPEVGLLFVNPSDEQISEILCQGRLYIAGRNRQLVYALAYADATALFEWNTDLDKFELKYQNINTPEGIEGRIEYPGNEAIYYIKDHLGSTREVINEQEVMLESVQYHSYGNQDIVLLSSSQARESFTGKEFDEDGTENGALGIQLYYFGARFYDPETGIWTSTDPAGQLFNPYGYANNPILFIDENGESFTAAALIIGMAVGAYLTASSVEGNYNPLEWNWDVNTLTAAVGGAVIGGVSAGWGSAATAGVASALGGGFASAVFGGIAGGVASNTISSFNNLYIANMMGQGIDARAYFRSLRKSVISGAATGGAIGIMTYGISSVTHRVADKKYSDLSGRQKEIGTVLSDTDKDMLEHGYDCFESGTWVRRTAGTANSSKVQSLADYSIHTHPSGRGPSVGFIEKIGDAYSVEGDYAVLKHLKRTRSYVATSKRIYQYFPRSSNGSWFTSMRTDQYLHRDWLIRAIF